MAATPRALQLLQRAQEAVHEAQRLVGEASRANGGLSLPSDVVPAMRALETSANHLARARQRGLRS